MTPLQQFIIQLLVTLTPAVIAFFNLNKRIQNLEMENAELREENDELKKRLDSLATDYGKLQAENRKILQQVAGLRDKF